MAPSVTHGNELLLGWGRLYKAGRLGVKRAAEMTLGFQQNLFEETGLE